MTDIQYDRYSLILNGQRTFIRSGAMHYFRLPSQALWRDRLFKLKAAGYNTVDLYFNWGFHSSADGKYDFSGFHSSADGRYDFSGIRDVRKLMEMAKELGLWVIARPGPYINAEVSGGGFPMWLLAKKDIPLRNRKAGQMAWSDDYMAYVRQWWEQILPIVNDFDNVLMVQIENEYSTLEVEPDYMQALYQMARDLGVTVPLSHNDLFIAGLYEDIVDLYAFDNYSVTQFETDWRKMAGVFSVLDNIENNLREFCQNRPLIAAELQAGWFGMWKGMSYENITGSLGREHINLSTKTVLSQGLTVFNHYKAIGGTNWAYIGSSETYTSYDFGAPISEVGINTIRLFEAKSLNYLLHSFRLEATDRVENWDELPFTINNPDTVLTIRKPIEQETQNGHWLFLRNLEEVPKTNHLVFNAFGTNGIDLPVEIPAHGCLILPQDMMLDCGMVLAYSNAEPIYQNKDFLILKGSLQTQFAFQANRPLSAQTNDIIKNMAINTSTTTQDNQHLLEMTYPALGDDHLAGCIVTDGEHRVTVVCLGQHWTDRFWQDTRLLGSDLLIGPDTILEQDLFSTKQPEKGLYLLKPGGLIRKITLPNTPPIQALPQLSEWALFDSAPELSQTAICETPIEVDPNYDEDDRRDTQSAWYAISENGLDFDANEHYDGSSWYAVILGDSKPATIQMDAMHIWAVYLNGHLLSHGHYLPANHEKGNNQLITITLPQEHFRDTDNTLLVFVDSFGHPKGFYDDEQEAQGLLQLSIDGVPVQESNTNVLFSAGIVCHKPDTLVPMTGTATSPLIYAETSFIFPDISGSDVSIGLNLNDIEAERVNIYLNGALIGRYWDVCEAQTSFYLPEGFLNTRPGCVNSIGLLLIDFDLRQDAQTRLDKLNRENQCSLLYYKFDPKFRLSSVDT